MYKGMSFAPKTNNNNYMDLLLNSFIMIMKNSSTADYENVKGLYNL
jgi:hypothetical protein